MSGYRIADLNTKTQDLIREKGLDKNGDGLINDDNDELANLLSQTGKSSIQELSDKDMSAAYLLIGEAAFGAGLGTMANHFLKSSQIPVPQSEITKSAERILSANKLDVAAYKQYGTYVTGYVPKPMTMADALAEATKNVQDQAKGLRRASRFYFGLSAAMAVLTVITALNARVTNKDVKYVKDESRPSQPEPQNSGIKNEWEAKFKQAFGEDTKLKEYTPQSGEYWISILQAKYGTDNVTAQKMANKIKELIYGDPKAAKQSPVMYLPETWNFEGKTYKYHEGSVPEKTENFSDEVKTEMGKMGKEIKYE